MRRDKEVVLWCRMKEVERSIMYTLSLSCTVGSLF